MFNNNEPLAQFYDRFLGRVAIGLFIVAMGLGIDGIGYFVEPDVAAMLKYVRTALAIVLMILVLPVFLKLLFLRFRNKKDCQEPESFVTEVYKHASVHGFSVVMLMLIAAQVVLGLESDALPTEFYIKTILATGFLAVSISFFIQMYKSEDDDFASEDEDAL